MDLNSENGNMQYVSQDSMMQRWVDCQLYSNSSDFIPTEQKPFHWTWKR